MILTDTPVRNEIAASKQKGNSSKLVVRKSLFTKAKETKPKGKGAIEYCSTSSSSSEETDSYNDESSDAEEMSEDEIIEGDFVVLKVEGKSREVHYIARIDVVDGDEFEGIFLQKMSEKLQSEQSIFIINSSDQASFMRRDIVKKLPKPKIVGGSARRSCQLMFNCNLSKWIK